MDVYRVGVTIAATNAVSGVLATIGRDMMGLKVHAADLEGSFSRVQLAFAGAGMALAGGALLGALGKMVGAAKELNHELTKLQTGAQLSDAQRQGVMADAFNVAKAVPGMDAAEIVKQRRELFGVFGNMDEADAMARTVALGSRVTSAFVDKDTDLAQIAVRALELRGNLGKDGKIDAAKFNSEFNAMVRSIIASEGLVDPQKLFAFVQQAGPATRNMDADVMWGTMPAVMNAMGASRAGTATMSLFSQMVGHVVAGKRVALAMEDAGMLTPGKWRVERGGHVVMDQDAVVNQEGFAKNPIGWLHQHLQDMHGRVGKDGKPIDEVGIMQQIFQLSSRATTARLLADIESNYPVIENEMKRFQRTQSPEAIQKQQNATDVTVGLTNFTAAWHNLLAALGMPALSPVISTLNTMTAAMNRMADWAAKPESQTTIEIIEATAAALAALAVVAGTAAVGVAIAAVVPFGGAVLAVAGSIAALGAAAVAVAAWSPVFMAEMSKLANLNLPNIGKAIADWALAIPGEVLSALHGLLPHITNDPVGGGPVNRPVGGIDQSTSHIGNGAVGSTLRSAAPPPAPGGPQAPVPVHVVNGPELAGHNGDAIGGGLASGVNRPPAGPSTTDQRLDLSWPGLGTP